MSLEVREEPLGLLNEHVRVSIAFAVNRTLAVSLRSDGLGASCSMNARSIRPM
jgi:hypothetical protein